MPLDYRGYKQTMPSYHCRTLLGICYECIIGLGFHKWIEHALALAMATK